MTKRLNRDTIQSSSRAKAQKQNPKPNSTLTSQDF
nr:MAG TPA: hypothetical protein [Caudoviricetes sp.]